MFCRCLAGKIHVLLLVKLEYAVPYSPPQADMTSSRRHARAHMLLLPSANSVNPLGAGNAAVEARAVVSRKLANCGLICYSEGEASLRSLPSASQIGLSATMNLS
jgi:hypothetical protein